MPQQSLPRSAGRPKSSEKRKQILLSATELLLKHGYSKASMSAVAEHSGVSKQTIYSHFANKDALYNAVIKTKCEEYRLEDSSICIETQALVDILALIGVRFIQLLNDKNVIAMYKVVISHSTSSSHEAKLFYDAGPLHSIDMVVRLLMAHKSSRLNAEQAREVALDFFNLLKGDFHMKSLLHLPYIMNNATAAEQARKVSLKTVAIINIS